MGEFQTVMAGHLLHPGSIWELVVGGIVLLAVPVLVIMALLAAVMATERDPDEAGDPTRSDQKSSGSQ